MGGLGLCGVELKRGQGTEGKAVDGYAEKY